MLENLINSKTRLLILDLLFQDTSKSYYAREIVNLLRLDPANVHKELNNLLQGGFIISKIKQGKKYFSVNPNSNFFNGLSELMSKYHSSRSWPQLVQTEEMLGYYPIMATVPWNVHWANTFLKSRGIKNKFTCLLTTYENNLCSLFTPKQEFKEIALEVLSKIENDSEWGRKYLDDLANMEERLYEATRKLKALNFKKYSDEDLFNIFNDYYDIYTQLHIYHWVQTVLDFDENIFSKYLMAHLKPLLAGTKYSLGDVFSVLTTPTREAKPAEEYRDLLEIYKIIFSNKKLSEYFVNTETRLIVEGLPATEPGLWNRIKDHADNFGFLGYNTLGPAWGVDYFIDILSSLVRQGSNPDELLSQIKISRDNIEDRQHQLTKDLGIDPKHQAIFEIARDLVFSKGTRKDVMFFSYSVIENLWKEIGRRNYLSLLQVRYLHPHEVKQLLVDKDFRTAVLNERYKFSLNFSTGIYEEDLNLTGEEAKQFLSSLDIIKEDISNIKILYGDCASPGRVRGTVRIVNEPKDMEKMHDNDILVSFATSPDLVPAIKKSAAIVTDGGGITCHAAIISRELGVPCVVGTKISTKVLHDGDVIDVNATHGKIDIIKKYEKKKTREAK